MAEECWLKSRTDVWIWEKRLGTPMHLWGISGLVGVKHTVEYPNSPEIAVRGLDLSMQSVLVRRMCCIMC